MKKILSIILSLVLLSGSAMANREASKRVTFSSSKALLGNVVFGGYDKENKLIYAEVLGAAKKNNENYTIDISNQVPKAVESFKLYIPESELIIDEFLSVEDIPLENPKDDEDYSIKRYPSKSLAVMAFLMVKSATPIVTNDYDETTKLVAYYRGNEVELYISNDITLTAQPTIYSSLNGDSLDKLKEGDIILCSATLSGKIRKVNLVYRPSADDIVLDATDYGVNFENLFSQASIVDGLNPIPIATYGGNNNQSQQYAFGMIREVNEKYISLCNKQGIYNNDIIVDISPDTLVYICDMSKRRDKSEIATIYDIFPSEFDTSLLDSDNNVLSWSNDTVHNYALVRMYEGKALDIALYVNYNL